MDVNGKLTKKNRYRKKKAECKRRDRKRVLGVREETKVVKVFKIWWIWNLSHHALEV